MVSMKSPVAQLIWLVMAIIFYGYYRTLSPSIAGGDSGEIVAEGCHLGIAHPPGYPLITMVIYMVSNMPAVARSLMASLGPQFTVGVDDVNNVAYHVNLLSALLTTFAAGCLGYILSTFHVASKHNTLFVMSAIIVSMGMFAFSPLIWQYAVTAEVFPLNTALAALLIALLWRFSQSHSFALVEVGAFICGLALCNQHTIVLYEGPLILWMLFLNRFVLLKNPMKLLRLGGWFVLGLSPYLYMPIIAHIKPEPGSWGHVTTVSGFLHHLLRKDYGTFQLFSGNRGKPTESMYERNFAYVHDFLHEQGLYVSGLLLLAGLLLYRCDRGNNAIGSKDIVSLSAGNNNATNVTNNSTTNKARGGKAAKNKPAAASATILSANKTLAHEVERDGHIDLVRPKEAQYTLYVLVLTQVLYFVIFHSLSNLPLDNKLLYGIHQRFWMQPNIISFLLVGVGYYELFNQLSRLLLLPSSQHDDNNNTNSNSNDKDTPTSPMQETDKEFPDNNKKESKSATRGKLLLNMLSVTISIALVTCQYRRNVFISDQSEATYFKAYATAILGHLPTNATLLINYDQQWTSVRYLQRCEGFRRDVTTINLSMMTYRWFQHKHHLYPHLTFPGLYHGARMMMMNMNNKFTKNKKKEDTFTITEFLTANRDVPIYLGGKLSVNDPDFDRQFDSVPEGLVSRLVDISKAPDGSSYSLSVQKNMQYVVDTLGNMPREAKYPEITWEWTIGRDFRDRVTDTAAYALHTALHNQPAQISNNTDQRYDNNKALIYAMYLLESAIVLDSDDVLAGRTDVFPSTTLLKNTGLAHVHLVQNKVIATDKPLSLPGPDIFHTLGRIDWPTDSDWKTWCSSRFMHLWGEFLKRPDAKSDPQYDNMKAMYDTATSTVNKVSSGSTSSSSSSSASTSTSTATSRSATTSASPGAQSKSKAKKSKK